MCEERRRRLSDWVVLLIKFFGIRYLHSHTPTKSWETCTTLLVANCLTSRKIVVPQGIYGRSGCSKEVLYHHCWWKCFHWWDWSPALLNPVLSEFYYPVQQWWPLALGGRPPMRRYWGYVKWGSALLWVLIYCLWCVPPEVYGSLCSTVCLCIRCEHGQSIIYKSSDRGNPRSTHLTGVPSSACTLRRSWHPGNTWWFRFWLCYVFGFGCIGKFPTQQAL